MSAANITADALALLRVICTHGPVTLAVLRGQDPLPGHQVAFKARVLDLRAKGYARAHKPTTPHKPSVLTVTPKGREAIAAADGTAPPKPARTRPIHTVHQSTKYDSYDGAELRPYTGRGPEAMRAFTLPSLVNGRRVEARSLISIAGGRPLRDASGRI